MPEQLCFLNNDVFPQSYKDIESMYEQYLKKPDEDADAFTWADLKNEGRSYFFFGKKIFEFYPGKGSAAKWRFSGDVASFVFENGTFKQGNMYPYRYKDFSSESYSRLLAGLQKVKKDIFRNTVTEKFACCHAFNECSDKKECLFPDDRFFNGCEYRKCLESGRIFYGKNKNI